MTQAEWRNVFGNNLVAILQEKGMSQVELALDTGISTGRISEYINEKTTPSIYALINIAYALDMDVSELVDFDERID